MTSPILFVGGEDLDFTAVASSIVAASANGAWSPSTTSGSFRSGYARQGMQFYNAGGGVENVKYLRAPFVATTSFWATYRVITQGINASGIATSTQRPLRFVDASGLERLRLTFSGVAASPNDTFTVSTVNAAGTAVSLGTSTGRLGSTVAGNNIFSAAPDKIDVFVNYATSGQISVYSNGILLFNYTGDITTNSVTQLAGMDIGQHAVAANANQYTWISEVIVSTSDTRNMSVVTQTATANGNTHNFTGGTAANSAATFSGTGDSSPNYSTTAGQIQEYTVTPAFPTGTFSVVSNVQKARAASGVSGPSKFDFVVRTGAADWTSADQSLTTAFATFANNWDTNPNTGVAWLTSEIVNASTLYNMGVKSVT